MFLMLFHMFLFFNFKGLIKLIPRPIIIFHLETSQQIFPLFSSSELAFLALQGFAKCVVSHLQHLLGIPHQVFMYFQLYSVRLLSLILHQLSGVTVKDPRKQLLYYWYKVFFELSCSCVTIYFIFILFVLKICILRC